jgi:hypothetical protein
MDCGVQHRQARTQPVNRGERCATLKTRVTHRQQLRGLFLKSGDVLAVLVQAVLFQERPPKGHLQHVAHKRVREEKQRQNACKPHRDRDLHPARSAIRRRRHTNGFATLGFSDGGVVHKEQRQTKHNHGDAGQHGAPTRSQWCEPAYHMTTAQRGEPHGQHKCDNTQPHPYRYTMYTANEP